MAKNNNGINKIADRVQKLLDLSYLKTFQSTPDNKNMLDISTDKLHKSIDDIMGTVSSSIGFSNVSMLYGRLGEYINDKDFIKSIEKQFSGEQGMANIDNLMSLYLENKHIRDLRHEIDIICKYMPILEDAIEYKQDLVLSSDDLKKDFLTFKNNKQNIDDIFANLDFIKNEHQLEDTIKDIYYKTSKYGEEFYAVIPYKKLLQSQIDSINKSITLNENSLYLDNNCGEKIVIKEYGFDSLDITVGDNSYPIEIVNEAKLKLDSTFNDNDVTFDGLQPDGIFNSRENNNKDKVNVNGVYVKRLYPDKTSPIYIENTCLGYHYIEVENESSFDHFMNNMNDPTIAMKQNRIDLNNMTNNGKDNMLKSLADKIVKSIDVKFINNNENLKKEIYLLMKHSLESNNTNLKFNIKFLPPDEVFHFYFKKDPKTHRGISDLYRSIIPAKLYCSIIISNVFGVLTRGQDKRIYYVKQSIDTNIAQMMLNTINQIKKSNFGLRDLNNLENILNITGRFNDYIIPMNSSGDSPINFEIMNGQDIQIKTELLEILESLAVNTTGTPIEILQARRNQVDFAIQMNSTNIKVLRSAISRQAKTQRMLSPFITRIYNYTFNTNEVINIILPPAFHANMDNTTLMVENTINYVNALVVIEYGDNPTEEEELEIKHFKRIQARQILGSMIDPDVIDLNKEHAKMLATLERSNKDEE